MIKEDLERINKRGPNDLEETIAKLKKQVEFLESKCRDAGAAIINQAAKIKNLEHELDRMAEENTNLTTMLKK
tara:strand:+ start:125 stop:343 length:219 start_codon:yes stop_codon:yes gene_type:complete